MQDRPLRQSKLNHQIALMRERQFAFLAWAKSLLVSILNQ